VQCACVAPSRLRNDGVIIFDNSDRPDFAPGIEYLHTQGYGRVDFYGLISQVGAGICTSVFSKSGAVGSTTTFRLYSKGGNSLHRSPTFSLEMCTLDYTTYLYIYVRGSLTERLF
jgi:hypothetical protein